jgi:hypothetical protein
VVEGVRLLPLFEAAGDGALVGVAPYCWKRSLSTPLLPAGPAGVLFASVSVAGRANPAWEAGGVAVDLAFTDANPDGGGALIEAKPEVVVGGGRVS